MKASDLVFDSKGWVFRVSVSNEDSIGHALLRCDIAVTIQYDTMDYINVRPKADE